MNLNPRSVGAWLGLRGMTRSEAHAAACAAGLGASSTVFHSWLKGAECPREAARLIARVLRCRVDDLALEPEGVSYAAEEAD